MNGYSSDNCSVLDHSFRIAGNITFNGPAVVHGRVIGNLECKTSGDKITISDTGVVHGDVKADCVETDGVILGNVIGKTVTILGGANVGGTVLAQSVTGIDAWSSVSWDEKLSCSGVSDLCGELVTRSLFGHEDLGRAVLFSDEPPPRAILLARIKGFFLPKAK